MRAPTFGVNGALGNALPVFEGELFEQLINLHQQRAARPGSAGALIIGDRISARCGQLGWAALAMIRFAFFHNSSLHFVSVI